MKKKKVNDVKRVILEPKKKVYTNEFRLGQHVFVLPHTIKQSLGRNDLVFVIHEVPETCSHAEHCNNLYCIDILEGNIVWKIDLNKTAYGLNRENAIVELDMEDDLLLATAANGQVHRVNKHTGEILGTKKTE